MSERFLEDIQCGFEHTIYLTKKNEVYGAGLNSDGQLGLPSEILESNIPKKIEFESVKVTNISCGSFFTYFLTDENKVYSCGTNDFGQLGLSTTDPKVFTPKELTNLQNIAQVACGSSHCFVTDLSGNTFSTGLNHNGQLGLNDSEDRNVHSEVTFVNNGNEEPLKVKKVICGGHFTFFLLKNGQLLSCGSNESGQLGLQDLKNRLEPSLIKIPNDEKIIAVELGKKSSFILSSTLKVYFCGSIQQLGIAKNKPVTRFKSLRFPNMVQIRCITSKNENSYFIDKESNIFSCGNNVFNQRLCQEDTKMTLRKMDMKVEFVRSSGWHSFFFMKNKILACGRNARGQLGIGNNLNGGTDSMGQKLLGKWFGEKDVEIENETSDDSDSDGDGEFKSVVLINRKENLSIDAQLTAKISSLSLDEPENEATETEEKIDEVLGTLKGDIVDSDTESDEETALTETPKTPNFIMNLEQIDIKKDEFESEEDVDTDDESEGDNVTEKLGVINSVGNGEDDMKVLEIVDDEEERDITPSEKEEEIIEEQTIQISLPVKSSKVEEIPVEVEEEVDKKSSFSGKENVEEPSKLESEQLIIDQKKMEEQRKIYDKLISVNPIKTTSSNIVFQYKNGEKDSIPKSIACQSPFLRELIKNDEFKVELDDEYQLAVPKMLHWFCGKVPEVNSIIELKMLYFLAKKFEINKLMVMMVKVFGEKFSDDLIVVIDLLFSLYESGHDESMLFQKVQYLVKDNYETIMKTQAPYLLSKNKSEKAQQLYFKVLSMGFTTLPKVEDHKNWVELGDIQSEHHKTVTAHRTNLLFDDVSKNLTLHCLDDVYINAHLEVLEKNDRLKEFLREVLENKKNDGEKIVTLDLDSKTFIPIMVFLYKSEIEFKMFGLPEIMTMQQISRKYEIDNLTELCNQEIEKRMKNMMRSQKINELNMNILADLKLKNMQLKYNLAENESVQK